MKTLKLLPIIFVLLAIHLIGCSNNSPSSNKIKVGAVIPLTGEVATYGQSLKNGFDVALSEYPGIFEIIYEDSKADKNTGISAINKLISSDGVKFVFGDATSGVVLATAPIAEKNKVILFDAIATSDEIIDSGDYIFRNSPSNYRQAVKAAEFIVKELKLRNVAIIYNQTDYGVNLSNVFKQELKKYNIKPLYEAPYQDGTTDFRTILTQLKYSGAQAVFAPGNYEETAMLLRQARQMGVSVPFIGTDGAYSPKFFEIAGKAADNFHLTMMGVDESNEMYQHFVRTYIERYNVVPDVFASYGYEAGKILFDSIIKSGNNADKVKQYLYNTTFESLTGKIKFDKNGEVARDYVILKVVNGKFSQ
jgi:branched-chain amino acid transport system substrate-binding protein